MYRRTISPEEKVAFIEKYRSGEGSIASISRAAGVKEVSFREWLKNYDVYGLRAFQDRHQRYSSELKETAVLEYLTGDGSQDAICRKYGIRSRCQLRKWIMKYNSHEKRAYDIVADFLDIQHR